MFPANFLAKFPHAWALGHDVALASLTNVAVDLYPYTKPLRFPPRTALIDLLPVRETAHDFSINTQGKPTTAFQFGYLPFSAFQYTIATYFTDMSGADLPEADMTVYLEVIEWSGFHRFNAMVFRPVPVRDYQRDGQVVVQLSYPMLLLEYLPEPEPEP